MNSTHIHLLLNHFPIIGTLVGGGLLLWGIIKKQPHLKSAAAVTLVLMALLAIPVYITGEPAEETVERLPGISEAAIEQHEQAAKIAIWLMLASGLAALVALIMQRLQKATAATAFVITLLLSAASFAAMARTGYYGGQIRHTEIAGNNAIQNNGEAGEGGETDDDKDDTKPAGLLKPVAGADTLKGGAEKPSAEREEGKKPEKKDDDDD